METKLYDTVQAAAFLGVSRERVSQLCRDGLLESKNYGRARLIMEDALTAFAQKERKAGRPKKEGAAEAEPTIATPAKRTPAQKTKAVAKKGGQK